MQRFAKVGLAQRNIHARGDVARAHHAKDRIDHKARGIIARIAQIPLQEVVQNIRRQAEVFGHIGHDLPTLVRNNSAVSGGQRTHEAFVQSPVKGMGLAVELFVRVIDFLRNDVLRRSAGRDRSRQCQNNQGAIKRHIQRVHLG